MATSAGVMAVVSSPAGAVTQPDGLTSITAAASCWEIKQLNPGAANGQYWLSTPKLGAPQRFYCDMTTDGGGWVLIGRGRDGWNGQYEGQGTATQVRDVVDGTGAFTVRALHSKTVDGLLNGGRVDALNEGVRLRRAADATGTTWQEARFKIVSRDRWVWTFGAEHRVGTYSFDGAAGSGGQTNNFGSNNSSRRVIVSETAAQAWRAGWGYGSGVTGLSAATSYLWSNTNGAGGAFPFTQVYVRPRLLSGNMSWPTVPDTGLPAAVRTPLLSSGAERTVWGVTGLANGRSSELDVEVQAFTQVGTRVFVGGNFRYVQRAANSTGDDKVEQPYLAAFDAQSGELIRTFRPAFNGQVLDLGVTSDGKLIVVGEFTTVNGEAGVGLTALDPSTGATLPNWRPQVQNRLAGGVVRVNAVDVRGPWVYLGGNFTHVLNQSGSVGAYARSLARVSSDNATPDAGWSPTMNGAVVDVDISGDAGRVYASGYFTQAGGRPSLKAAAVYTSAGAPLVTEWVPTYSAAANYQQAVLEAGQRVWLGGSEHSFFSFDTTTFQRVSGNITKNGGDFQAAAEVNGMVYGACHCANWNYSNAYTWSSVGTAWTQADKIGWIGAWNSATGAYDPEFDPVMRGRKGLGPWAIFGDDTGVTWAGGDMVSAVRTNGSSQWVGAFVRFRSRDTTAPTAPSGLGSSPTTDTTTTLRWNGSTDNQGPVEYHIYRENQVVATTTATEFDVPAPTTPTRYFVRAVDGTGNLSATTAAHVVQPGQVPPVQLIANSSSWSWRYVTEAWPADWTSVGFDDSAWNSGAAALGFGSSGLGTNIDVPPPTSNRPLSAKFRHRFEVDDAAAFGEVTITTRADDGLIVFVNGTEVGRAGLPAGAVSGSTYATGAPRTNTATANPVTFTVPASVLQDGTNVVAVSTHLNYRGTPDVSFDLQLVATPSAP